MHVLTILYRILSTRFPEIHAKRLARGYGNRQSAHVKLYGRGLHGQGGVKHNIKRIDRLLGNSSLHIEIPKLFYD